MSEGLEQDHCFILCIPALIWQVISYRMLLKQHEQQVWHERNNFSSQLRFSISFI